MKFNNTYKQFNSVTQILIKGLRDTLKLQEYHATGKLSRSFVGIQERGKNIILNIISNKDYWRVVNDPRVAFSVNRQNIIRWMNTKGLDKRFAGAIFRKLKKGNYGKPYVFWQKGNTLTRKNFAGIVASEESQRVANELAPAIGKDVAEMMRKEFRKIKPTAETS